MSVFIGSKNKRVELAERKDAINPNLLEKSKSFIMITPWGNVGCGSTIHGTKSKTGSIYLSADLNNVGIKADNSTYFSCESNTYYTESLWVTSSVALNDATNGNVTFQSTSAANASVIDPKLINLGSNRYKIVGSFYSGTNMANFDIGYIINFQDFLSADADISFDALKIEKGTVATLWCPALEDYAWTSDITTLQNTVNSKTSGTVVTAYDVASKKPTTVKNSYTSEELVDQGVLGQFADQINQLKGRQTVDAPDFNTLTDTGVYYITNTQKGKNFPSTASWGTLAVFSGNGQRTAQIFAGDFCFMRVYGVGGSSAWSAWNQIAWTSDITNLQNQIQADKTANKTDVTNLQSKVDSAVAKLQGQITEIQSKNYIEGYNCANESDAETYSKAHPNTLVTVS